MSKFISKGLEIVNGLIFLCILVAGTIYGIELMQTEYKPGKGMIVLLGSWCAAFILCGIISTLVEIKSCLVI